MIELAIPRWKLSTLQVTVIALSLNASAHYWALVGVALNFVCLQVADAVRRPCLNTPPDPSPRSLLVVCNQCSIEHRITVPSLQYEYGYGYCCGLTRVAAGRKTEQGWIRIRLDINKL